MSLQSDELQARLRQAEFMWRQIAHERVKERLDSIFTLAAFRSGFALAQDDVMAAFSAQASRFRNSTSRIVARDLEEAVFKLEDNRVQSAYEIYCDETPQRKVTDTTLLWLIYNLGLIPFIETRILRDACFNLESAQPSLGINLLRADGERFFSYRSERLRSEFPVVIRIVDRLKADWGDKIAARARQIAEQASVTSPTALAPSNAVESGEEQMEPRAELISVESSSISESQAVKPLLFVHSETYESIMFRGKTYTLQERQAAAVRLLHEALKAGHPAVPKRKLLALPGCEELDSVRDLFKSRPELWGDLIVNCEETGEGRGFYRLNPSIDR